jgi:hypothetical protein
MKKWLRITLLVAGSLLLLLILLWLGLTFYIRQHKAVILQQISNKLNEQLHGGQLVITDMEPSLIRSFPQISVVLQGVTVRDSLWSIHHHPLLEVASIFVQVNTRSLLKKQVEIRQITLSEGTVYLFTDSTGYSNISMLQREKKTNPHKGGKAQEADITALRLENMSFVMENMEKHKLFHFDISHLNGHLQNNDTGWVLHMETAIQVKSLSFNTDKGSFLKDKSLETTLDVYYNRQRKILDIPQQSFRIAGQNIAIGGTFSFGEQPRAFSVHITADKIPFQLATSLLTPKISAKLDSIHMEGPLDADAQLNGYMQPGNPAIFITWKTTDNVITTKGLELRNCSFTGSFSNEWKADQPRTDENSIVRLYRLKALCYGLPVATDSVDISNLKHPTLTGFFRSDFPLTSLNNAQTGDEVFNFTNGTAKAALYYKGGITKGDTIKPFLKGTIQVQQGAMEYTPRNLQFHHCNALLDFTGEDLYLKNITIESKSSKLQMEGSLRNIATLYYSAPEKLLLDWKVSSTGIDLNEFRSFLGKRKSGKRATAAANRRKMNRLASQLDVMLNSCSVNLQVALDKLTYSNFLAQQVKAEILMSQSGINMKQISLSHAGGSVQLNGTVTQDGVNNRFKVNTNINNVHIDQLLFAFDNFGMKTLTSKNLKGIFSAKAAISGNVKDNGQMAPESIFGKMSFNLREGALVNFAPLQDIGDILFRKRDLANITFENVTNNVTLEGGKIMVPPMQINSSALYMDVSGIYAMDKGTDMYIDIPLRNPKRDEEITDKEEKLKRRKKGLILHLRATDDSNGKVRIKLGSKKEKRDTTGMNL